MFNQYQTAVEQAIPRAGAGRLSCRVPAWPIAGCSASRLLHRPRPEQYAERENATAPICRFGGRSPLGGDKASFSAHFLSVERFTSGKSGSEVPVGRPAGAVGDGGAADFSLGLGADGGDQGTGGGADLAVALVAQDDRPRR
jgi:hypothetical protein